MIEIIPTVELLRVEENESFGTFGVLLICAQAFCVTIEPADLLNRTNLSSIPAQQYTCRKWKSYHYGATFKVYDVPNRDGILFHPGNTINDTEGCIILASSFGKLGHQRAILNSGKTFKEFLRIMQDVDEFKFTVKEVW